MEPWHGLSGDKCRLGEGQSGGKAKTEPRKSGTGAWTCDHNTQKPEMGTAPEPDARLCHKVSPRPAWARVQLRLKKQTQNRDAGREG